MYTQFVIHAPSESDGEPAAGFWSNSDGWTFIILASVFSLDEREKAQLPEAAGGDAAWMPLAHAYDPSLRTLEDTDDLCELGLNEFNGIEIQGVRSEGEAIEVNNSSPEFFSVYLHRKTGGVQCVGDFGSPRRAAAFAESISRTTGWTIHNYVPEQIRRV